jgi:CRISPR-associated endonuclease/helicase Cas3
LIVVNGPSELEALPRYENPGVGEAHGKVLCVRNTVDRAVESWGGVGVLYHSRFRYVDRVAIQERAVQSFRASADARLCATQVAEMSLDISADHLDTDEASIPALIQRLGRLDRFGTQRGTWSVRTVEYSLPYEPEEIEQAQQWLDVLRTSGRRLSQCDLIAAWERVGHLAEDCAVREVLTALEVKPAPTRDEGMTIPVLLETDVSSVPPHWRERKVYLRGHEVPVLLRREVLKWAKIDGVSVAPSERVIYDPVCGASWAK